jgi:hypothetical protein
LTQTAQLKNTSSSRPTGVLPLCGHQECCQISWVFAAEPANRSNPEAANGLLS